MAEHLTPSTSGRRPAVREAASALWRWFRTGIPARLKMDEHDHAALIADVRQKFIRDVYLIAGMITIFNVIYWFTDDWLMGHIPGAAEAFALGRAKLVGLALAVMVVHALMPQRVYVVGTAGGALAFAIIGNLMGRVGSPSTLWFGFQYPFLFVMIAQWLTPLQRAAGTLLYGAAMLGGYFAANPAWLHDPMIGVSIGYFLYLLAMIFLLGVYLDYSKVRLFMAQRDVQRARAHLEERVQERTATLQKMVAQMDRVQDTERSRLARELHDEVGQVLTAQRLAMRLTKRRYNHRREDIAPNLDQLEGLLDEVTEQFRAVLRSQRATVLDELGLERALQQLADRCESRLNLPCALHMHPVPLELEEQAAGTVYRCVQEGLTNAAKHARATQVRVEVVKLPGEVLATVSDDGVGIAADSAGAGFGLLGVRERVAVLGGRLELEVPPEGGTRLRIRLPVSQRPVNGGEQA